MRVTGFHTTRKMIETAGGKENRKRRSASRGNARNEQGRRKIPGESEETRGMRPGGRKKIRGMRTEEWRQNRDAGAG